MIDLENAIGLIVLGLIVVSLLALLLYAQVSLSSASLDIKRKAQLERAKSEESIRISWISDEEILLTNDGARDTVVRYLYIYPEGSRVPSKYVSLNITLHVGESRRISIAAMVGDTDISRVDVVTELGCIFSSIKPNRLMEGIKVGG